MIRTLFASAVFPFAVAGVAHADLVAQWNFDGQVEDQVGLGDGTATDLTFVSSGAGATGSSGFGQAGDFDGSTSGVSLGSGAAKGALDLGIGDFTIAGWFNTPTNFAQGVAGNRPLVQNIGTDYTVGGWILELGRADRSYRGKPFFTVGGGSASVFNQAQLFSDVRLDDDAWHWIAVVNSGGALSMYVDGVLQADTGTMQPASTMTPPAGVEASFGKVGTQTPFEGELDEWRVYNDNLSAELTGGTLTGGELFAVWQQGVPEPASIALLGLGGLAFCRRSSSLR